MFDLSRPFSCSTNPITHTLSNLPHTSQNSCRLPGTLGADAAAPGTGRRAHIGHGRLAAAAHASVHPASHRVSPRVGRPRAHRPLAPRCRSDQVGRGLLRQRRLARGRLDLDFRVSAKLTWASRIVVLLNYTHTLALHSISSQCALAVGMIADDARSKPNCKLHPCGCKAVRYEPSCARRSTETS